jgi:hypothetical protein
MTEQLQNLNIENRAFARFFEGIIRKILTRILRIKRIDTDFCDLNKPNPRKSVKSVSIRVKFLKLDKGNVRFISLRSLNVNPQ